jgi:hypothetical protein
MADTHSIDGVDVTALQVPFRIGDIYWLPVGEPQQVQVACPVCAGQRTVMVILGSGERVVVDCDACGHGYDGPRGTIHEWTVNPTVRRFVIAAVTSLYDGRWRVRSQDGAEADFTDLFATDAEALAEARRQAIKHEDERMMGHSRMRKGVKKHTWAIRYHREQIKDAERQLAYHRAKLHMAGHD